MKKINTIDLFAGCGGLMDGFEKSNFYNTLACVEWEEAPCENLEKRLREKWNYIIGNLYDFLYNLTSHYE